MITFKLTKDILTDWAIETVTMDGSVIVVYFDEIGGILIQNGLTYNGEMFQDADKFSDLFTNFGNPLDYSAMTLKNVVSEAEKQIGDIVAEAKFQDALFDAECKEADYAWTRSLTDTGRV